MVNTELFRTAVSAEEPLANAINQAGGRAYALSPRHQLAQLASTSCLNQTRYSSAESQLKLVILLAGQVDAAYLAKLAVHARQAGHMKDMPVLLAALLASRDVALLEQVFSRVVDNGKQLRSFVQMLRSGVAGRRSLGTRPKRLVQQWLETANEQQLLSAAVGNSPSLADVVKMVHPKPTEAWRAAWFARLIGRPFNEAELPPATRALAAFKQALEAGDAALTVPKVPFQFLTALPLQREHWVQIARAGSWQMVRQNLNTFVRQGVFTFEGVAEEVAAKLRDPQAVARAKVFPYQLLATWSATSRDVPKVVRDALEDAVALSLSNVPVLSGKVVVCPDVSGSMYSAATGWRNSESASVSCLDVAALVAAAVVNRNPQARVLPFSNRVLEIELDAAASVMVNARILANLPSGSTDCSVPLARLNEEKAEVDTVIFVSDNESWFDSTPLLRKTDMMRKWDLLKQRQPRARMICIDIQPNETSQAPDREDVLNIGGFSDSVFTMMAQFVSRQTSAEHWVGQIEQVALTPS